MPIGLGTALTIGAGVLGAGATIYGASQASHAQTSAANTAASAETNAANTAAAAQLKASEENNQLARDMYGANAARLDPYSTMGLAAGDEYMGLLLGNSPTAGGTNKSSGWAPVVGAPTGASTGSAPAPTPAPAPAPPPPGYTGPGLGQITTQAQMDAYLAYYQQHPEIAPPFTSTDPFHGDAFVDENAAGSILAAHNAYLASHPATTAPTANALAPFAGAPGVPLATAPASAPANAISPVVQLQAQQAIAAGADPAAVQARVAQLHGQIQ